MTFQTATFFFLYVLYLLAIGASTVQMVIVH